MTNTVMLTLEGDLIGVSCNECFEDHNAHHVKMQADGNLVKRDSNWELWASDSKGMNSRLIFHEGSVFVSTVIIDAYGGAQD